MKRLVLIICLLLSPLIADARVTAVTAGGGIPVAAVDTISYRSEAHAETTSSGSKITVNKPANTAQGDIMIAAIGSDGNGLATCSGWTVLHDLANGTSALTVLYKVAGESEGASYEFSLSASNIHAGIITTFQKTGGTWDVEASSEVASSGAAASLESSSITCTNNSMLYLAFHSDGDGTISTAPADMTSIYWAAYPSGGTLSAHLGAWYEARNSGAVTKTVGTNSDELISIAVCLDLVE
jgi:hypothetical protein